MVNTNIYLYKGDINFMQWGFVLKAKSILQATNALLFYNTNDTNTVAKYESLLIPKRH